MKEKYDDFIKKLDAMTTDEFDEMLIHCGVERIKTSYEEESYIRKATKEEREVVDKYLKSISEPVYALSEIKEIASKLMHEYQPKHNEDDPNHYLSKGIQMLVVALDNHNKDLRR